MKFNNKYIALTLALTIGIGACETEEDLIAERKEANPLTEETLGSSGSADLSNYIAIGNSLTAGFADAALSPEGQLFSIPNILAGQMQKTTGAGEFVYPNITSGNGYGGKDDEGSILGKSFIDLEVALAAIAGVEGVAVGDAIQSTTGSALNSSFITGSGLNNFGVPGARIVDLAVPGYGSANPYFGAFQSSAAATILGDAVSTDASFFSLWIGSNDILGYAVNGGAAGETFDPFNPKTITDAGAFSAAINSTLDALSANGAEGVILNVPPITLTPFFQIVTTLSGGIDLIPLDAATAAFLNSAYAPYNAGLDQMAALMIITQQEADWRKISFAEGDNPPVITDESLTDLTGYNPSLINMRQAKVDPVTGSYDLFPLTALAVIGAEAIPGDPTSVYGVGVPIPDESTLTLNEQVNVIKAYAAFNAIIEGQVAARPNINLVDVGPLFADVFGLTVDQAAGLQLSDDAQNAADSVLGTVVGGFNLVPLSLSQEELYYSIWSTDGLHPNPTGAGLFVNEIIKVINSNYNATIPEVNPLDLPGINAPL